MGGVRVSIAHSIDSFIPSLSHPICNILLFWQLLVTNVLYEGSRTTQGTMELLFACCWTISLIALGCLDEQILV